MDPEVADMDVPSVFESVWSGRPDDTVLVSLRERLTSAELSALAGAVAHALAALSPSAAPVLVIPGADLTAPVAMLGTAMAGRSYLVLDPDAPVAFMREIAVRHGARAVVTDPIGEPVTRSLGVGAPVIDLDTLIHAAPPHLPVSAHAPLSVSTTSGSTGVPKSVVHSHRNVVHNALTYGAAIDATREDRFLVVTPFSGVSAATPTYTALLTGAVLCVHPLPGRGLAGMARLVADERVTVLHAPPTVLLQLAATGCPPMSDVRLVTVGGDRLLPAQARAARALFPNADLLVRYNTSEANWIAGNRIPASSAIPDRPIPIGTVVPWKRVRVVGRDGVDVRPGETGELLVSSDHLALGYLDDPALTAERFFEADGSRWYRTNDRVRRQRDGVLEFAGREDHVVKVRGVLVDLDRVEQELLRLPGVTATAVAAVMPEGSATTLVALVVGDAAPDAALRRALGEALPAGMLPSRFERVPELPLTTRGKTDRERVAEIAAAAAARGSSIPYARPVGSLEFLACEAFAAVLQIERVGRNDNVFDLGADSLAVAELCARLSESLKREVPTSTVVANPTPAALVAALASGQPVRHVVQVYEGDAGTLPLALFSGGGGGRVDGMALLARAIGDHPAYAVMPRGFEGRGRADGTIVQRARHAVDDLVDAGLAGAVALVGYSSGGTVAMETARELVRRGLPAPAVVLLDTVAVSEKTRKARSFWPNLRWQINESERSRKSRGLGTSWARRGWWTAAYCRARATRRLTAAALTVRSDLFADRNHAFQESIKVAGRRHLDGPYDGDVRLVRAAESLYISHGAPDDLRWSEVLGRDIPVTVVPGEHEQMLFAAYIGPTAAAVRAALSN